MPLSKDAWQTINENRVGVGKTGCRRREVQGLQKARIIASLAIMQAAFRGGRGRAKKITGWFFFMLDILFSSMYKHNSLRHGSLS
jgi:hypothetical protein